MKVTQGIGADFTTARLEAIRTSGARENPMFSIPEEPEPPPRRAREAPSERDHKRTRERDTLAEHPFESNATAWAGPLLTPVTPTPPTSTSAHDTAEALPPSFDRAVRKADPGSNPKPEHAPNESKAATASSVVPTMPGAAPSQQPGARLPLDPPKNETDGAAKARSTATPTVDGAASHRMAPPDGTPATGAAETTGAPLATVAAQAAQTAVETVVVPTGVMPAQGPMVPGTKSLATDPALPKTAEKAAPVTTVPTVAGALPTVSQRQTDNGLTPVNASAQGAFPEGSDPLRTRLQDALRSSIHQRVLQQAANGEVVLPGLGRVSVSAHAEDASVAVEVHAAQAATARLLHASAGEIAADVLAADIPLSTLSFAGAGTWSQSDAHAPPPERDATQRGGMQEETPTTPSTRSIPTPAGRVRIVL